jgi:L-ascorbate 6-phosphate lactonase
MLVPIEIENCPVDQGVKLWSLGGPSIAIRSRDYLIYVDLFSGIAPQGLTKGIPEIFDPTSAARAEFVLSTHKHMDHCHRESLTPLNQNTKCLFIGPASCNQLFRDWNFDTARTRQVIPGDVIHSGGCRINVLPSNDQFAIDAVTYLIEIDGIQIFESGDSDYFQELNAIGKDWNIDIALLNTARNPPGKIYYMDEEAVVKSANDLHPKILILKHYDLWKEMSIDPTPLLERLQSLDCDARILHPGENLDYRRRLP